MWFERDFNLAVDKNIDWKLNNPNKEPEQKRVILVRFTLEIDAFLWNIGLHFDRTLSFKFTVKKVS